MTRRRILIVVENLPVPFDRRVWLEATTLARHGAAVTVICPKAKGFTKRHEMLEDVAIYRYPLPFDPSGALGFAAEFVWCFVATALLSLWVALFGRGFDVLHACNPPDTFWLLGRFWQLLGRRFVFDHHDLCPEMFAAKFGRESGWLARGLRWLERQSLRAADVVITTNESHKRVAIHRGGKRPGDVFVVRSGPDLDRFTTYPADPSYRAGKPHLLVYLGEICKQDGVDYMVRAVKLLAGRRGDFQVVFIGGGPHQPAIKAYAAEQGISDFVHFTGRVSDDELCRILSSATLGIDPDPKTPWSDQSTMNKVIEYMFFGLPVVAFDLHERECRRMAPACMPRRTRTLPWPTRSAPCWTTRPGAPRWARRAGSAFGTCSPGSIPCRICSRPMTRRSRHAGARRPAGHARLTLP